MRPKSQFWRILTSRFSVTNWRSELANWGYKIITSGLWIKWYVRFFDSKSIWSLPPKDQALNLNSSLRKTSLGSISVVTRLPSDLWLNTIRLVTKPVSDHSLSTISVVTRPMSDLDTSSVVTRLDCTLFGRAPMMTHRFIYKSAFLSVLYQN